MKEKGKTTMIRVDSITKEYIALLTSEAMERKKKAVTYGEALREFIEQMRPDLKQDSDDEEVGE